ncbi:MAG TPA: hypothetical protein VHP58_05780 [Alphaproteobacteria bacterium]|nr:hypothetical protein [Alphaproteobacteria bacterium]
MIPEHIRTTEGRRNIPGWVFGVGVILLIVLAFVAWIGVGMSNPPAGEPTTQDVPLAH